MHHRHEFLSGHCIVAEASKHSAGYQIRAVHMDAAAGHAMMGGLDDNRDTLRLQYFLDRVRNLGSQAFLDLQPFRVNLYNTRKFGDAHDASIRNISDPGTANNRRNVMFAMAFKRNAPQDHHFIIAVSLFKGLPQDLFGVLPIASEVFLKGPGQTVRRFSQAIPIWVFSNPAKDLSKGLLHLRLRSRSLICAGIGGRPFQGNNFVHRKAPNTTPEIGDRYMLRWTYLQNDARTPMDHPDQSFWPQYFSLENQGTTWISDAEPANCRPDQAHSAGES